MFFPFLFIYYFLLTSVINFVTDDGNNRYSKNRNLWRKVYNYRRRKPKTQIVVDSINEISLSYDLNQIIHHRDFFIIRKPQKDIPKVVFFAEFDEGLIDFTNTDASTIAFTSCFSNIPDAVVLSLEPANDYSDNIIAYGISFDSCSMSIGLSAPFSGTVRYRAAYSINGYPAQASSSLVPSSGVFTIDAGHVIASNADSFSTTYNVNGNATLYYTTPWDFFGNFDTDVFISNDVGGASSTGTISAPLSNPIYFIAFKN